MSAEEFFIQLSLWVVNSCLNSYTFCLHFLHCGSGSTKLLNTDPIRIRIHNTGYHDQIQYAWHSSKYVTGTVLFMLLPEKGTLILYYLGKVLLEGNIVVVQRLLIDLLHNDIAGPAQINLILTFKDFNSFKTYLTVGILLKRELFHDGRKNHF